MGLLNVKFTDEVMSVSKTPGIKSLGVFAGILSLGLGAAYYGSDNLFLKVAYVFGCFIVAGSCLEDLEECLLDKVSRKVQLRRSSFFQTTFKLKRAKEMDVNLNHVISVRVESKKNEGSTTYNVALLLKTGMSLPIFESGFGHNKSDCDLLVERIRHFLKLSHIETVSCTELNDDSNYYSDQEDSSSDSDVRELVNLGRPRETVTQINEAR